MLSDKLDSADWWLCCHRPGTYYVTIGLVAMYHVQQSFVFEHRRHLGQWWDLPLTKREHWWKVEKYFEQSRLPTGALYIWYELLAWQHKPAKLDQRRSNVFFCTYQIVGNNVPCAHSPCEWLLFCVEYMIWFLLHVASDQNDHLEIGASDRYRGKLIMMINDHSIWWS